MTYVPTGLYAGWLRKIKQLAAAKKKTNELTGNCVLIIVRLVF